MAVDAYGDVDRAEWGLRRYVQRIAVGLGVGLEAACCEAASSPNAYLALDGRLPGSPGRDVALLWDDQHGWALGLETASGEDLLLVSYLGGPLLPDPETVVVFAKTLLAGLEFGLPDPPTLTCADLIGQLAGYTRTG